jgi:hypothetical protein
VEATSLAIRFLQGSILDYDPSYCDSWSEEHDRHTRWLGWK